MAEICCGVLSEKEASQPCEKSSPPVRKRKVEIRKINFVTGVTPSSSLPDAEKELKCPRLEFYYGPISGVCGDAVDNFVGSDVEEKGKVVVVKDFPSTILLAPFTSNLLMESVAYPKFGMASVCGRRRNMEDAVAIHPRFCRTNRENEDELHYFAVYDGHGCSHVAFMCRERLHELVREELETKEDSEEWKHAMERSFNRMDKEVIAWNKNLMRGSCRCELQTPECDAVGSTAVVAVITPLKIIIANCGDSRAVLCRNGKAIALSNDHKPDRPDELSRIEEAGGRVIYWDGPRVLGVLAMSRAIGDNYLKPYVTCQPEVMVIDRTPEDECLILASDGLWDVVSNDTACSVAGTCLKGKTTTTTTPWSWAEKDAGAENSDKACSDASTLLAKLALARRSSDNVSVVVVDLNSGRGSI
ncbi:probable protein phosphatase 2C 24 [Ipomoea triloba]|uniref:probable protein phosphatase 2C 24 n=1 Tax=Ipomoea triloba TaxID=35885 RepID=UPI00125E1A38|nr:probable protein phosphatase 2C 24 [Ipomoea triloba]